MAKTSSAWDFRPDRPFPEFWRRYTTPNWKAMSPSNRRPWPWLECWPPSSREVSHPTGPGHDDSVDTHQPAKCPKPNFSGQTASNIVSRGLVLLCVFRPCPVCSGTDSFAPFERCSHEIPPDQYDQCGVAWRCIQRADCFECWIRRPPIDADATGLSSACSPDRGHRL